MDFGFRKDILTYARIWSIKRTLSLVFLQIYKKLIRTLKKYWSSVWSIAKTFNGDMSKKNTYFLQGIQKG